MTWFTSEGIRRLGCTCDFNDPHRARCDGDVIRCNGVLGCRFNKANLAEASFFLEDTEDLLLETLNHVVTKGGDLHEEVNALELDLGLAAPWTLMLEQIQREMTGHAPDQRLVMLLANKVMRTHGVESLSPVDQDDDFEGNESFKYLNMGDMYARTLVLYKNQLYLASYEDIRKSIDSIKEF